MVTRPYIHTELAKRYGDLCLDLPSQVEDKLSCLKRWLPRGGVEPPTPIFFTASIRRIYLLILLTLAHKTHSIHPYLLEQNRVKL